jgi:hypothetical protein
MLQELTIRVMASLIAVVAVAATAPAATAAEPGAAGPPTTPPVAVPAPRASADGRFIDNTDGTVTDSATGLMWERKLPGKDCTRCVEDAWDWHSAMSDWLSALNGVSDTAQPKAPGHAGYSDWRLPDIDELMTIVDCERAPGCIDPIFGPNAAGSYWSATTKPEDRGRPSFRWGADFRVGASGIALGTVLGHVRAVRGSARTTAVAAPTVAPAAP